MAADAAGVTPAPTRPTVDLAWFRHRQLVTLGVIAAIVVIFQASSLVTNFSLGYALSSIPFAFVWMFQNFFPTGSSLGELPVIVAQTISTVLDSVAATVLSAMRAARREARPMRNTYNFAFLDEGSKREIRRAILKGVAIPGYQVPFASREMPIGRGWGTGGLQVTLACVGPTDVLKVIDQGADDSVNAVSIRGLVRQTTGVSTTSDTRRATLIQSRHRIPETPLTSNQLMHSTFSDGSETVAELIDQARARGLARIAITDHDSLSQLSVIRARSRRMDFPVLAGVEVSAVDAETGRKVHVLGYGLEATIDGVGPLERLVAETLRARIANTLWQAWVIMQLVQGRAEGVALSTDKRSIRTRHALGMALAREIDATGDLSQVTVTAVTERAGVTRRTFYSHFRDIPDLVCQTEDEILDGLRAPLAKLTEVHLDDLRMVLLPSVDQGAVDTGLKYVNNDICYPSILTTGQIMEAVLSGRYDLSRTAVLISQTGGGCRATNYIALIRKALKDSGHGRAFCRQGLPYRQCPRRQSRRWRRAPHRAGTRRHRRRAAHLPWAALPKSCHRWI